MYAVKIPSYTKNYKLNGHLFQVYNITKETLYQNNSPQSIISESYIDFDKNGKVKAEYNVFYGRIFKNPKITEIEIGPWNGVSPMAYFDSFEDAIVFKAKANERVKQILFENLEKIKQSIEKQTKKISINNKEIINKYPEHFL